MTWLYIPGTSCPSAQASEASNSESCSPSIIAERLVAASATWRGKPQQPQAWSRRWKQGGFIRRLSGLTCSPSTLDHGVARFISSLRETPARTTALPESALAPTAIASSPPRSAASPRSAGLILSSGRTSRAMLTDSSGPSSRHWSDWATALRREYSARPQREIPCGASDCSSWPSSTSTARPAAVKEGVDHTSPAVSQPDAETAMWPGPRTITGGAESAERKQELGRTESGGGDLQSAAIQWEAPSVAVTDGSRLTRGGDRSNELLLTGQAIQAAKNWSSPKASDDGQKVTTVAHQRMLCNQAASFRPPSSPAQPIAGGSMSSTDSPSSNQPSVKRKLNPIFVEALMRWPTGLSGFERQETAWIRWWLLMPSYLSALVSASDVAGQGNLFGEAA